MIHPRTNILYHSTAPKSRKDGVIFMPIYKMEGKKDGLQKYRVRVNFTDSAGKAKQLDRVAYGKEEARELERKLQLNLRTEAVKRMTLSQLISEYLKAQQYEIRESSLEKSRRRLRDYIEPYIGDVRIDKLTKPVLKNWKLKVEELRTSKDKPFALATKQGLYTELRAVLNYAVAMDYIPAHNLKSVGNFKDPYATKTTIDFYTSDEFIKFIAAAKKQAIEYEKTRHNLYEWNYYVFFMIAFYTGMRKGEINALTWNDLDNDTFHITKSVNQKLKGADRETPPKNLSSSRDVKLPLPLQKCISEHRDRLLNTKGFSDEWHICGGSQCLRDTTIENRNTAYAKAAKLKHIRIHDFRHSHASYLAHCGINIQEIARRLGHAKVEITWNTYSHLYPKEEDRAIEALNLVKIKK